MMPLRQGKGLDIKMNQLLPDIRNFEAPKDTGETMGKTLCPALPKGAGFFSCKMIEERKGMGVVDLPNWRASRVWFHFVYLGI